MIEIARKKDAQSVGALAEALCSICADDTAPAAVQAAFADAPHSLLPALAPVLSRRVCLEQQRVLAALGEAPAPNISLLDQLAADCALARTLLTKAYLRHHKPEAP
jgi:hypothetical protein